MKAISPKVWGAAGWAILHRLSFVIKSMREIRAIFEALKIILPCPACRNNLTGHLGILHVPANVPEIPEFVFKLHKRVNDSIDGKQKSCITFAQVKPLYAAASAARVNESEWIFIEALVSVHKGFYKETAEFTDALKTFLDIWVKHSDGIAGVPDTTSKTVLKDWLRKNKKHSLVQFSECSV